jgi:hypothetical protein
MKMNLALKGLYFLFALVLACSQAVVIAQPLSAGTSMFVYSGYSPLRTKPLNVYYHIPQGNTANMPILFVFHGDDRDGRGTVADWISAANANAFMVFCPEFTETLYPGGDGYNLANIFVDGDNPTSSTLRPDSIWAFSQIDPLFLNIQLRTLNTRNGFIGLGHSAGAQFLHRFHLYKASNLMQKSICANAGWYTTTDFSVTFPYGLGRSPITTERLAYAFAKPSIIQLGAQDRDPNSAGLRHNATVDVQGLHRFDRGNYFFNNSRQTAQTNNQTYNWTKVEEAGIGHDRTGMARRALPYVLESFLLTSATENTLKSTITGNYAQGTLQLNGLSVNETYTLKVFTLSGALTQSSVISGITAMQVPLPTNLKSAMVVITNATGKQQYRTLITNP